MAREIRFPILGRDGLLPARFLPSADAWQDGQARVVMTKAERDKLLTVAEGATVNSADVALRARSTHTGKQPAGSIDASGAVDGRVLTARGGETVWGEQPIADFSIGTRHINPSTVIPPSNLGVGQLDSSAVLHGDGVFRQVTAAGGGGGGGGAVGFTLEMHPTDPGIAVLTIGATNPDTGQPQPAPSGPSAVSVTVDSAGRATCSASMTATNATYTELNISISTPSPNPSWRASVARTMNVTVNGVKALVGTSSPLPPGSYEAYVSSSKDGGETWQTGPRTSFTVSPTASGGGDSGLWPANVVGQYMQVWPSSPGPQSVSSDANVIVLGFVNTNNAEGVLKLVGYSQAGRDALREAVRAWRAAGKKVGISAGGAGYDFDLRNPDAQAQAVKSISDDLGGLDFFDFDVERRPPEARSDSSWTVDRWVQQHLAFCDRARRLMGSQFGFTMAPGGSTTNDYYTIAAALNNAGYLTQIGHQFYEWDVTDVSVVVASLNRAKNLGIPAAKIAVGMMLGTPPKYWSQSRCVDWMTQIRDQAGVTKAYLWEASLAGSGQWASNMRGVLPW